MVTFRNNTEQFIEGLEAQLKTNVQTAATYVKGQVQDETPVDTGNLERSITTATTSGRNGISEIPIPNDDFAFTIGSTVNYAASVEVDQQFMLSTIVREKDNILNILAREL